MANYHQHLVRESNSLPLPPELRSTWQHKNGNLYIVEEISNRESDRQAEYPTTVIYRNVKNGNLYSRRLADWYRSMTLMEIAAPTVDQIEKELRASFSVEALKSKLFETPEQASEWTIKTAAWIARGAVLAALANRRQDNATSEEREVTDLLAEYLRRQWEWSLRTFGPGFRTAGILQHIRKELGEVEKEPHDLMEWIDIIILAFDGFWRHGGSPERVMALLQKKQDKNFARNWPDWRTMGEDKAIEHDRSGD